VEVWHDIEGYEGIYQVSDLGNVKSLKRQNALGLMRSERILKPATNDWGYKFVVTYDKKSKAIHKLVALAFIGKQPGEKYVANHKNGIKTDNRADNLEWITHKENIRHAWRTGLASSKKGAQHPNAKLTNEQAREIRELYKAKNKWDCTHKILAEKYNVSTAIIYKVLKNITYKEI
jgi:ERCC4-related helicase